MGHKLAQFLDAVGWNLVPDLALVALATAFLISMIVGMV